MADPVKVIAKIAAQMADLNARECCECIYAPLVVLLNETINLIQID